MTALEIKYGTLTEIHEDVVVSNTSGSDFRMQFCFFVADPSASVFVGGEWRGADLFEKNGQVVGCCEWYSGSQKIELKFTVKPNALLSAWGRKITEESNARASRKKQAWANQETFLD